MKNFIKLGLMFASVAIILVGCKKDKDPVVIPTFNPPVASVKEGSSMTVTVTGKAPFTIQGVNATIADVSVSGDAISIEGNKKGETSATVIGSDGGSAVLGIVVTETSATTPIISPSSVQIAEKGTSTVTVSGGVPAYTVTSQFEHIADVEVNGSTITVKGYSAGTTTVTVKGSDNESATFNVTVTGDPIFFGPARTQIGNGNAEFSITGDRIIKKGIYTMCGWIFVEDGAKLTIEPGTIIKGTDYSYDLSKSATGSSMVVKMGGKIFAEGTKDEPIVFTSANKPSKRQPSDWGGIIILGKAKNNLGTMSIEGVGAPHGGDNDDDNSGILRYVRIEFAGYPFSADNEINGLTLGSVGSGTTIDHIQVSYCGDDSYEWFGGSVNAKYLVAYHGWDDDFDTDNGFSGKLQFLLGVRDPKIADQSNSNGFESDNNADGSATPTPRYTTAVFSNVTLIGPMGQGTNFENYDGNYPAANLPVGATRYIDGYGWSLTTSSVERIRTGIFQAAMQIRRNSRLSCFNSVFTGYPVGLMLVPGLKSGAVGDYGSGTHAAADNSDMYIKNVFFAGMGRTGADMDNKLNDWKGSGSSGENFSEEYFKRAALNNEEFTTIGELGLKQPNSKTASFDPRPLSSSPLRATGAADFSNLTDPFFTNVNYAGAFADENDNWMEGWTNFDPQNTDY